MAKNSKQLADFFHDILKDIYFAEKKVLAALPKITKARDLQSLDRDARPVILWRIKAAKMIAYT